MKFLILFILLKFQTLINELPEKQQTLSTITQTADTISQGIALEGATALKGQVATLKSRVAKLGEALRQRSNSVSDVILSR